MMFFKGERFAMFLAPVIGAGFGLFFHYLFMKFRYRRVLSCGAVFAFVVLFSAKPFLWVVPAPVVDKDVYAYIASINGKLEKDSLIASWWDNGFLIQYLTGYAVFTDGASQGRLGTKLVADLIARRDVQSVLDVSGIRPVYMLLTSDMFNYADSIFKASGFSDIDGEIFSRSMFSHFVIGDSDMIKWHSKTVEFPSGKLYKLK
jgi:dolichyl-diphosphooligosaccharide--protein glycosyltransferase